MNKNDYAQHFGFKIQQLRKEHNLSQEAFAESINKSVETVSKIERGLSFPRLDTALDIANTLNVELYELFMVNDLPLADRTKTELLTENTNLLKDQPVEISKFANEHIKMLISLKDQFIRKISK